VPVRAQDAIAQHARPTAFLLHRFIVVELQSQQIEIAEQFHKRFIESAEVRYISSRAAGFIIDTEAKCAMRIVFEFQRLESQSAAGKKRRAGLKIRHLAGAAQFRE
jgi:hypothetical protein